MSSSPRNLTELEKVQAGIFSASSHKSSQSLSKQISLMAVPSKQAEDDLQELYEKQLLGWDFNMKVCPVFGFICNPAHVVKCVAYYGDEENGYKCIGYAIGSINEERGSIEIDYIEKRKDSPDELRSKFLPIVVDAYASYALYLNRKIENLQINEFAFINPVEDKLTFYQKRGFEIIKNYSGDCVAAVKYLTRN